MRKRWWQKLKVRKRQNFKKQKSDQLVINKNIRRRRKASGHRKRNGFQTSPFIKRKNKFNF